MRIPHIKRISASPIVKATALVLLIVIPTSILRGWLGDHSPLATFAIAAAAWALAAWKFTTATTRKSAVERAVGTIIEHRKKLAQCIIYTAVGLACHYSVAAPAESFVVLVLRLVESIGIVTVCLVPLCASIVETAKSSTHLSVVALVTRFLRSLALLMLALWLIRFCGDALYRAALAKPQEAVAMAIAVSIIWWMVILYNRIELRSDRGTWEVAGAIRQPRLFWRQLSTRDQLHLAGHEAGHVMVFASLDFLPHHLAAVIHDRPTPDGTTGYVTAVAPEHFLDDRTFAEWRMLLYLAGQKGEMRLVGQATLGSTADHAKWTDHARRYLANHFKGVYFDEPRNEFEHQANEQKLAALQTEQSALLDRLFDLNGAVHKELAEALLAAKTLDRERLAHFLGKVQLPEGFPRPRQVFNAENLAPSPAGAPTRAESR